MTSTFTTEVQQQLTQIGFAPDEIEVFDLVHQFKERQLLCDLQELIREYSFRRMMAEATQTWDARHWNEETVFEIVEQHRQERRQHANRA